MKTAKGKLRFVVLFPSLGIAVKFPRIYLISAIRRFVTDFLSLRLEKIYKEIFYISTDCAGLLGYKRLLFAGIKSNWKEFTFYRKTKNPFCQPTYFSFLGLFNVQKLGTLCTLHWRTFASQLDEISDCLTRDDGHHFDCPENFCFSNGKLMILDYGSAKTQKVITESGQKIQDSFDPNWVEEKQK